MAPDKIYGERSCKHCVIRIYCSNVVTLKLVNYPPFPVMSFFPDYNWRPHTDVYNVYHRFYCVIRSCDIKRELSFFLSPLSAFSERNRGESVSPRVIADVSKERTYAASATHRMRLSSAMKEIQNITY